MIPWKHSPSSARAVTVSYAVYREGYRFASTKERDTWGRVWEGFSAKLKLSSGDLTVLYSVCDLEHCPPGKLTL